MQRFAIQRTLTLSALLTFATSASAQQVLRTFEGPIAGGQFAAAMLDAGDTNGDGYDDVLVGAPGYFSGRGAIYMVSGKFLATGAQPKTLWALSPASVQTGDRFGASLAAIGDLTGDGKADFAVGAPDAYDFGAHNGKVFVVDGASHASWATTTGFMGSDQRFGFSMDTYGDWNGDGKLDLVVGAPGSGKVFVVSGAQLAAGGTIASYLAFFTGILDAGWSVASGFDYEGDGDADILVGSPLSVGSGSVALLTRAGSSLVVSGSYTTFHAGDHLGLSVDARDDYDGDGLIDFVVGAPYADTGGGGDNGSVTVLSKINSSNPVLFSWSPGSDFVYFGAAVRASADLNGDGVGDILVGGPNYGPNSQGRMWIYSGATGEYVGGLVGSSQDRLGEALLGAFDDLDGDGYPEFCVAGPLSDAGGNDSGLLKCARLFPVHASSYCTSKPNSLGCLPGINAPVGFGSISSPAPYLIHGTDFLNQKSGLLFYGFDATSAPFQGGTLCVAPPLVRTGLQTSGGDTSGASCTGAYAFDFNAHVQSGVDPNLVVGRQVFCQYWARDPQSASTTSLSDALRVFVNP